MVTAVCSIESIIPVCSIYKIKSVSKLQESIRMNEPTIRLPRHADQHKQNLISTKYAYKHTAC